MEEGSAENSGNIRDRGCDRAATMQPSSIGSAGHVFRKVADGASFQSDGTLILCVVVFRVFEGDLKMRGQQCTLS